MDTITQVKYKPAPTQQRNNQRELVRWELMTTDDLRKTIDLLDRHASPHLSDALLEFQQRYARGEIGLSDAPETPPPLVTNVPKWLYTWPFRLLWSQRSG